MSRQGLSFGLRLALGFPIGELYGGSTGKTQIANNLGDQFGVLFPATIDAGYRLAPHWYVGGFFAAGVATPSTDCKGLPQCDLYDIRFGLEAKYMVSPTAFIDPWFGAGLGWESANYDFGKSGAGHIDGPEFLHLRAGLDFRVTRHLFAGPEAMFTFAAYADKPNAFAVTLHDWFTLGVSGHYDL